MDYGYVRVSSKDQNVERQLAVMKDLKIPKQNIFIDRQSGKDFNRPLYKKLLRKLRPGDTLFVKSIDRLGRNYEEIIEEWRTITKHKKADIVVTDLPLLDTRGKNALDLTGVFISDLVLQILSYVSQTEREQIRKRQAEGIAVAKARGVSFGRPPKEIPKEFDRIHTLWKAEKISGRESAKQLGTTHNTFFKWVRQAEEGRSLTQKCGKKSRLFSSLMILFL